jgi:hypothetical protein
MMYAAGLMALGALLLWLHMRHRAEARRREALEREASGIPPELDYDPSSESAADRERRWARDEARRYRPDPGEGRH